jgi:hypothetical protein
MAEIGKPPIQGNPLNQGKASILTTAALVFGCGLSVLIPTAAMAQFPIPMIPNFNFGPQHYRSGSSHSRSHSQREEEKAPDKSKEKDATQVESNPTGAPQHQSSNPPAPSGGPETSAKPTPSRKSEDDAPAFAPSR